MLPDLNAPLFPQQTVLKVTGLSSATLQNWANRGIIKLGEQNPGRQARRLYSQLDMMRLVTIGELTRVGISAARAAEFADEVVVKHAHRLQEIHEEAKRTGQPKYGYGCQATFYYEENELKCKVDPTGIHSVYSAAIFGLRRDMVRIVVDVSDIVYHVQSSLLQLEIAECDRIIAEHEARGSAFRDD